MTDQPAAADRPESGAGVERRVARVEVGRLGASGAGDGVSATPAAATEVDVVAIEEPLEIRVNGEALAVTMRTPGDDEELALGFLVSEGILAGPAEAASIGPPADLAGNVVDVVTAPGVEVAVAELARNFYTSSSCGICGKGAIEAVAVEAPALEPGPAVPAAVLATLPERLRAAQPAFDRTGGIHATGLFDRDGQLLVVREDVGRHNAMDKAIGRALMDELDRPSSLACVSGRASFELVQKLVVARVPVLVAVGAPSSLAVALAQDRALALCGFARSDRLTVYAGAERVEGSL